MTKKANTKKIEPKLGDNIPKSWLSQARAELKSGFRAVEIKDFKDKGDVTLHLFHPNIKVEAISSRHYAKTYNKCIEDGFMLRAEMLKLIEEKSIWGKEQEELIDTTREAMREIEFSIAQIRSKPKHSKVLFQSLREKWFVKQEEIKNLITIREGYLTNTAEGVAEDEVIRLKLSLCVKYADGTPVWKDYEELEEETDRSSVISVLNEAVLFWSGLTQEIISSLPDELLSIGEDKSEN